ncbi:MAG TPA: OFA family MFS transporter [Clostridiaceae bacterium]|nr:OFA family MFS transporter [Clostridiaceae bacterium]
MRNFKGWIVTSAATGINLILGVLYIWSIMSKALIKEFGWTSTEASLPYTVCTLVFAVIMIFAGKFQDIKGPRLISTIGGILLGCGLLLSGITSNPLMMVLTFGILGGAGIGFCYAATTPSAVKWFPVNKKGLISGIVVSGVGFAAVYISPLTNSLLLSYGISKAFFYLGTGAFILLILFSQLLFDAPTAQPAKTSSSVNRKQSSEPENNMDYDWKDMLKTPNFYKLWIMYAFTSSAGLMIIGHIANIAIKQAQWENGYMLVVLLAIFNTLGRIIGGFVSDRFGHTNTMRFIFLLQAVNMAFFSQYLSYGSLSVGVAIAGLCYGALFSVFPAATAESYGIKNLGVNYGLVFTAWGFGGVIGPMLAARIIDSTGSYNASYVVSAALLIIASALTFLRQRAVKN